VTATVARWRVRDGVRAPEARLLDAAPGASAWVWLGIGAGIGAVALVIAQAWLLSTIVAAVFIDGRPLDAVVSSLGLMAVVAIARGPVLVVADLSTQRASTRTRAALRRALSGRLLALGPTWAGRERTGELTTVIVDGLDGVDAYITTFLPARALAVAVPLLVLAVIALIDPPTTAVLLFTGPILVLLLGVIGGRTRVITERRFAEVRWLGAFFVDILAGISTLKLFGRSAEQVDNLRTFSRRYADTTMEMLRTAFQTALVLEWGAAVAVALVAVEISLRLMAGTIEFQRALAVLVIVPEFFLPLRNLAIRYHAGSAGQAVAGRIAAIFDEPVPALAQAAATSPLRPVPTDPIVRLDGVVVTYPGRTEPALRGVDLTIPPRGMLALVGPTGAGKTTIANVLLGFVTPTGGTVRVDDAPLAALDPAAWRRWLAWVPQRPHLFHGTIADNIRLARPEADEDEIAAAAGAAGVDAFLADLPLGPGTPVGDDGIRLSGGQRQRIAIARAILADARLVVLDEATSQLDRSSEAVIRDTARRLAQDRAVVVVSHRLALAAAADTVAVVEAGCIVETGSPAELVAAGGAYARLLAAARDDTTDGGEVPS
jgi:ATP-binding cassette subfamily C protein CydD